MEEAISPKIGLALSGGGSRAMAFHLGCLRALDRLGLLHRIDVLSTVSGGSVIGVFFHSHDGDFASFEAKMREILSQGLAKPMCRKLFSPLGLKVAAAFALIGIVAVMVAFIRTMVGILKLITPTSLARHFESFDVRSPLHRFASRTSLLEAVFDELLFGGASMSDLPATPHLVVNATELRTGSAFRFGTRESGSWRWGKLHRNDVSVAHAVAASAAYPLFLPAFDETFAFDDKDALRTERVVLTYGGIYDNHRSWLPLARSLARRQPKRDAGRYDHLLLGGIRLAARASEPVHAGADVERLRSALRPRAERFDSPTARGAARRADQALHFSLSGQLDKTLPNPPSDLVRREEAHAYPTDFNAMPTDWIDRLSLRGEQLTTCLARAYIPHLIDEASSLDE
jgi:NTE family protein